MLLHVLRKLNVVDRVECTTIPNGLLMTKYKFITCFRICRWLEYITILPVCLSIFLYVLFWSLTQVCGSFGVVDCVPHTLSL